MVRHGNYKLILFGADKIFDQPFPPQLFDLIKDPHEMTNVANELPEVVSAMSLLMDQEVDIEKADSDCKAYNLERFKTAFYTVH
jgi:arylsulfatase A-like enzyme|eukprot:COSAG02_NODE_8615_length_2504_cov_13.877755_1_plen_84_part_00